MGVRQVRLVDAAGRRPVSARRVRTLVRRLARLAAQWQCNQCGEYFESDTASQTCSACS